MDYTPVAEVPQAQIEPAQPGSNGCGPTDAMIQVINDYFGEKSLFTITDKHGLVLTMYVNPSTLTWTMLATNMPNNQACIMDSGKNIQRAFDGKKQGI